MDDGVTQAAQVVPVTKGQPEFQRPADLPFTCSDDNLIDAVQTYLCGGSVVEVGRLLGIKHIHVKNWTSAKGWKFIEDCVRDDVRKVAHSHLTRIVHRCFNMIDERLEKGDPIYDLEGQVIGWRPVKVKDLAAISDTLYGKMHDIEDRTSGRHEEEQLTLKELADSLRNYAQVKNLERTSIPGITIEKTFTQEPSQ
jgi:hypothetical protein